MFWISRGIKKWFQWRKALIGGDCSGMLRFCAPLGTPAINLHTIAYKSLKTKRGKKARSGNSRQHDWKKQYSPYPRKKDATNQNIAIQIDLPCRPPLSSLSKVWGLLHHWRLWLPTTNSTASQEDEPNKLPNSLSVIRSHCRPYLVEGKKKNGGETVFRVFHGRPQLFSSSPLCFFFFVFFSATDHLGRCTLHLR